MNEWNNSDVMGLSTTVRYGTYVISRIFNVLLITPIIQRMGEETVQNKLLCVGFPGIYVNKDWINRPLHMIYIQTKR